jgi:transcriptional regulator with GAF, ATPase, and Fis domain
MHSVCTGSFFISCAEAQIMQHDELLAHSDAGIPFTDRTSAVYQLQTLRTLLERDYSANPDWLFTVRNILEMVSTSLGQAQTMLAFWDDVSHTWNVTLSDGTELQGELISTYGSTAVLEWVRHHRQPLLTLEDELLHDSHSVTMLQMGSIIAVPLYWLEEREGQPQRIFAGCLYAHRTHTRDPFLPADVQLTQDIAHLTQPILNLLHRFQQLKQALELERSERERLQNAHATVFSLGSYRTRDAQLQRTVLEPLKRACNARWLNVLIMGPSGSGKSHLAEAVHYSSSRKQGPFVVLDCSQITSAETLGAELFGYTPDSGYHNAPRHGRQGKARLAHQGTLFIDEIGCLPLELQQKLLRLIERGSFCPLGSSVDITVDVQIIAATNETLESCVRERRFREDLFWRLNELVVRLPPLNERAVDIPELAQLFLADACQRLDWPSPMTLSAQAQHRLLTFDWSQTGNIRGLEQTILRSVLLAPQGSRVLDGEHIRLPHAAVLPAPPPEPHHPAMPENDFKSAASLTLEHIKQAIREHGYATAAARSLGLSHRQLTWQLQRAGLSVREILAQR